MENKLWLTAMVRTRIAIIVPLIVICLIPSPLNAQVGQGSGHVGSGGHGRSHSGSIGHGWAGHNSLTGLAFLRHSGFANRGFHNGHFHHRHHKRFGEEEEENFFIFSGIFFDLGIVSPFVLYLYDYPNYNYYYQTYGDLKIAAIPEEVEIYVDGRFIGRANDFKEAALVLISSGTHVVEFRYKSLISSTKVSVEPDTESFVGKDFRGTAKE